MLRSKRAHLLAAAAVLATTLASPRTADAWFVLPPLVFDAQHFLERVQDVARQAEQVAQLRQQIEGDLRLLAATDVSTLAGMRAGLDRLRDALTRMRAAAPADAGGDLARRYPLDWRGGPSDAARYDDARGEWVEAQRTALAQIRSAQNAVVTDMPSAAGRVERLVAASNGAPGLTAALQSRTQLHAELGAELSELQALRDAQAFARAEREGAEQSAHAFSTATAAWLLRPGTVPPVESGPGDYAVAPVPEPAGGGRR